jgi:hypothetical protein
MARCARRSCRRWRPDALIRHGRLGIVFDERWYCSSRCLEIATRSLLAEVRHHDTWVLPPAPPLGRLLVQRQAASERAVHEALHAQRLSGRRLGAELVAMGAARSDDVLCALAAQAGVGYVVSLDAARVADGPGGLARETVAALRVVPFDEHPAQQRLLVACTAPLPRTALAALREMTGRRIEPFFVTEATFDRLVDAYGRRRRPPPPGRDAIRTLPDAAASIARAAEQGTARRMHPVRCDPYLWVRLEGEQAEDLMVSLEPSREDTSWQVGRTRH